MNENKRHARERATRLKNQVEQLAKRREKGAHSIDVNSPQKTCVKLHQQLVAGRTRLQATGTAAHPNSTRGQLGTCRHTLVCSLCMTLFVVSVDVDYDPQSAPLESLPSALRQKLLSEVRIVLVV